MIKASTSILIKAPLKKVWDTLINVKSYSDWNPFVCKVVSSRDIPDEGTEMVFSVQFENGKKSTSNEYVTLFLPPNQNNGKDAKWTYRFDGFLHKINMIRATRVQTLKLLPDGITEYYTEEVFVGWGKKSVPLEQVQKGFETQAEALKKYCEK